MIHMYKFTLLDEQNQCVDLIRSFQQSFDSKQILLCPTLQSHFF